MRNKTWLFLGCLLLLGLYACPTEDANEEVNGTLGQGGGSYRETNGAVLRVPRGSLDGPYLFELREEKQVLPKTCAQVSPVFALLPKGVTFLESLPATLILPIELTNIPKGQSFWNIRMFVQENDKWTPRKAVLDDGGRTASIAIQTTGTFVACVDNSLPVPPPAEPLPQTEPHREGRPDTGVNDGESHSPDQPDTSVTKDIASKP